MPPITRRRGSGNDHSCFGKGREVERRLRIVLGLETHDIISEMCSLWGTANADEFYMRMNAMTDSELASWVDQARKRVRARKMALKEVAPEIYA
jgi:hypothetical protein